MDQRELEKGISKFNQIKTDGGDVAEMLSSLPRVTAPENFTFRVKARIAEGSAPSSSPLSFLKLAGPLSLTLAIAAVGLYYVISSTPNEPVISDASVRNELPIATPRVEPPAPGVDTLSPQFSEPPVIEPQRAAVETDRPGPVRRAGTAERMNRSQGGSVDSTLESANTILPRGFESVSPNRNMNVSVSQADIPVRNVLEILGINAEFVDGGWKVRSATVNSSAYRAGIRAGDVIESIDGQVLARTTTFNGEFTGGRTFRVRRDGKTINVGLKD
jgi:hypothetical protein